MEREQRTPNQQLRYERTNRGWSQKRVADVLETTKELVSKWECGTQTPSKYYQEQLCLLFGKSARELGFLSADELPVQDQSAQRLIDLAAMQPIHAQAVSQARIRVTYELGSQPDLNELRRKILEVTLGITLHPTSLEQLPLLGDTNGAHLPFSISVEEFFPQCAASIRACWHLMKGKGFLIVEETIATFLPTLTTLTFQSSRYQQTAASLMTQVKILQAVQAMHRLDLAQRELYCLEAVRVGRISGDRVMLAAALMYLGYTYTYCILRPDSAVDAYTEALHHLGNDISLIRSDIYMGLADAYAKQQEEDKALDAIERAKISFPSYPERDPSFFYADCGWSELYQWEGKMYLDLARQAPERGYYQKAYEAFALSTKHQSIAERSTSETIIHQAEAFLGLGDLPSCVASLQEGALIARSIGSKKRWSEALDVFHRMPEKWKQDQKVMQLAQHVFIHTL